MRLSKCAYAAKQRYPARAALQLLDLRGNAAWEALFKGELSQCKSLNTKVDNKRYLLIYEV